MSRVLVTGAAGFIGLHVVQRLLARGDEVIGVDNLNDYYEPQLKHDRLALLADARGFVFRRIDIADAAALAGAMSEHGIERVVNLAAQAGVRHSILQPFAYGHSNLTGFLSVLEACRHAGVAHLVYASSSSVYGGNTKLPFSEDDRVDSPVSLYAATKRANEVMAYSYSHLYGLPATGLRLFTVYGPWGRPDMAYFSFTKAIFEGRPIEVYNHGRMARDFTYVDDVAEGVLQVLDRAPAPEEGMSPHALYNVGNHRPEALLDFIACIEKACGRKAELRLLPMQDGDVAATFADIDRLAAHTGFRPSTPLAEGIGRFVDWYRRYYGVR